MIATLVTTAVLVVVFAAGEYVASSAAHMHLAEAEELLQQAMTRFREHRERKQLEDRKMILSLRGALNGAEPAGWKTFLSGRSAEQRAAIEADLQQAEQALDTGAAVEFRCPETRLFIHLFRQQEARAKKARRAKK